MLKEITSKCKGDSYCLNCFHSYRAIEALEKQMKICEDKDYCYIEMPKKGESLKYHPGVKSMKAPLNLYLEKWILVLMIQVNHQHKRKMNMKCVDIHCSLTVHSIKKNNKLDYYRGKDFLKRLCQDLKKQARSIIDFEKKEMNLTPEEEFSFYMAHKCYICKNHFIKIKKVIILM